MLRRAGMALLAVVLAISAGLIVEFGVQRPYTPPIDAPRSVASLERVRLNGVEQTILVRGLDRTKPILLFLHGGPGMPVMFMAHAFQRNLEQDFMVVHWDRRGAGKSYAARDANGPPTVRQTLDDTYALTNLLRRRFGQDRIYLVGHSWGTYLGLLAAYERPNLYWAYVGMGQMAADAARIRKARENFFRVEAERRGDAAMLDRLGSGDDITEDDLFRYGAELRGAKSFWPILLLGLRAPEYTLGDVLNVPKGAERVAAEMAYDVISGPLDHALLAYQVPIYFLLGRFDWNEPSILAAQYLSRIDAPAKRIIWFENSAHFPFVEEPERFHATMLELDRHVRGTAAATAARSARR